MAKKLFSQEVSNWLKSSQPKDLGSLGSVFQEKGFAVAFLILMAPAALPLPTAGITHVLEIITMLLALELVIGRQSIWLPDKWKKRNLGKTLEKKALPKLISFINWFERRSHKRLTSLLSNRWFLRFIGLLVFILALASLLAVPFSGLDTLPALGVVLTAMALILEDALILIYAMGVGLIGIIVEIGLGSLALHFLHF